MSKCFIIIGLVYDAVGVWTLARAFAFGSLWNLHWQSLTVATGNVGTFEALILQRFDARWGLTLIVLGFGLQIVGVLWANVPSSWCEVLMILLVPALCALDERRFHLQRNAEQLFDEIMQKREAQ